MADKIISVTLPQDLPENWNDTQYVSPGGLEVGLSAKHGYNYLMHQVNNTQKAANELDAEAVRMKQNQTSHSENKSNPHGVTKSQVGLGEVPNVSTNDQTPTYTQAGSLANLVSGEKLSISFGKIMKAIAELISHLANKSNPHSVTADQVGAIGTTQKGAASGVASLGADGKVPSAQLPAMNYAPAGFGLGGNATTLGTGDNFDNYTNCGFYGVYISSVMQSIANRPPYGFDTGEFELLVHNSGHQNYLIQELTNNDNNVKCRRYRYNGKFYEWEYINPPMEVGVQYRTTERYKNQVVYAKVNTAGKIEKYLSDGTVLPDYIQVSDAVVG